MPVWWIAGSISGLHLLQLVPLPPVLWHGLPGRDSARAALELVDAGDSWRPLSLTPMRTLASLLAALSALALLVMTSTLNQLARWRLIAIVAGTGILMLAIGAAQVSGGPESPFRFHDRQAAFLLGFHANHNSAADAILIAMLALAVLARHWMERQTHLPSAFATVPVALLVEGSLAIGLLLTGSRAGLLLFPLVMLAQVWILCRGTAIGWKRPAPGLLAAAIVAALVAPTLRANRAVGAMLDRFSLAGEFRPELWHDAWAALWRHWPAGSGKGSFAPVMIAAERLEVVDQTLPHRAHDDFLELAIEAGPTGLFILGGVAVLLSAAGWRALRHGPPAAQTQALFGLATLSVFILHSLIDYPLRSMALAALAAVAAGMLYPAESRGLGKPGESHP